MAVTEEDKKEACNSFWCVIGNHRARGCQRVSPPGAPVVASDDDNFFLLGISVGITHKHKHTNL